MPAKRVDPEDGVAYTWDQISEHYTGKYKKKAIEAYWEDTCYSAKAAKAKAKTASKPKEKAKAKVKVKAKAKATRDPPKPVVLWYFPLKARGMPALLALEVGKVSYEAHVVQMADWGDLKATGKFPFGYLAGLELADGTMINETNAVLFTAGKLARLNGVSTKDFGLSTMLACKAAEVFGEFTKVQPTIMNVKDWNADKAKALAEATPKLDAHLEAFEKLCDDDGKITKIGKTTVGELHLFSLLYHMKVCKFKSEFPGKLEKFYSRIAELDGVKNVVDNKTKMGELGDYVVAVP